MTALVRRTLGKVRSWLTRGVDARLADQLVLSGKLHARYVRALPYPPPATRERLRECEFKVFSQRGEDGVIQYLVARVPILHRTFIEFGVEDYREANTRFLLADGDWQGLVLDGSAAHVERIRRDDVHWRHDLQVRQAFVTRENIDLLLAEAGFAADVGLLSIDIDGNDYWVWEAITAVRPRIVVCEVNAILGREPVSVPYAPDFRRMAAHASGLYFGASLAALEHLAQRKGYVLVGCESSGSNAFFVRSDLAVAGLAISAEDAYLESHVRQSRNASGELTFVRGAARRALISHLPVVDVTTGRTRPLG